MALVGATNRSFPAARCLFCGAVGAAWFDCSCQWAEKIRQGKLPRPRTIERNGIPIIECCDELRRAARLAGVIRVSDEPSTKLSRQTVPVSENPGKTLLAETGTNEPISAGDPQKSSVSGEQTVPPEPEQTVPPVPLTAPEAPDTVPAGTTVPVEEIDAGTLSPRDHKRQRILAAILVNPDASDREIAQRLQVHRNTVKAIRAMVKRD